MRLPRARGQARLIAYKASGVTDIGARFHTDRWHNNLKDMFGDWDSTEIPFHFDFSVTSKVLEFQWEDLPVVSLVLIVSSKGQQAFADPFCSSMLSFVCQAQIWGGTK